jgi:hypothetical protein
MTKTRYLVIARMAGNFAMVGESTDPNETLEKVIRRGSERQVSVDTAPAFGTPSVPVPVCAVHDRPMDLMHGRRGPFWSCHQKNEDGTWCDYKPDSSA